MMKQRTSPRGSAWDAVRLVSFQSNSIRIKGLRLGKIRGVELNVNDMD